MHTACAAQRIDARRSPPHPAVLGALVAFTVAAAFPKGACAVASHTLTVDRPILEAEDGLLLGNGDLSVSVYQSRDKILWRLGKGDVWDRRLDTSEDPKPPHIREIAHGIAQEGWKCPPYGGAEPVALRGTDNPERMKELCKGSPPSYRRRPYPCPKPVGELALHIPPDLPGLSVRQELTIEEGILRIRCTARNGIELQLTCFIPPQENVLVVRWDLVNWAAETQIGKRPPLRFSLYRWADPPILQFAQQYRAESLHGAFHAFDAKRSTPLPRPTTRTVAGQHIIEQTFPPEPTFPEGFRYVLSPFVSEGSARSVDTASVKEARLSVEPPAPSEEHPDGHGWLVIAACSSSDREGPDGELSRVAKMLTQPEDADGRSTIDRWQGQTQSSASAFWSRSAVQIADPVLENLWYETYHARRCTTKAGKTPPGLFLPSTVRDYSHWHGDYHTNYNYQQPFWGDYTANHLELGDAYFTGMDYFMQMGKIIAEKYYGTRGVFIQLTGYPILSVDDALGAVPMGRMAYMTGWASNLYWARYLYTRDEDWLRQIGYPAIRDCALFYLDFMQKRDDGLYHIFPSNQGEDGFTGDPKDYTDRAQVMRYARYCLRSAILASEALGVDDDLREQWRERLNNAAGDDGKPPYHPEGVQKLFYEANPPEFGRGRPYKAAVRSDSPTPWPGPGQWTDLWYAGQYVLMAMPNLRHGGLDPEGAYLGLRRIVDRWRHPNGLIWAMSVADYGHAGAWTETLGICAPLQEMMLQSFGGVLRVFPCWPADVAATFTTFRAEGAFLISASWADGTVTQARITSERGGVCRLYSPWPRGLKATTAEGKAVAVTGPQDDIYSFETEAGESYLLAGPDA